MQIVETVKRYLVSWPIFRKKNRTSLIISIVLHLALIVLLIILSIWPSDNSEKMKINVDNEDPKPIVNATVISQKQLQLLEDFEKKKQQDALALKKAAEADRKKAQQARKAAEAAKKRLEQAKQAYQQEQEEIARQKKIAEQKAKAKAEEERKQKEALERKKAQERQAKRQKALEEKKAKQAAEKAKRLEAMKKQAQRDFEKLAAEKAAQAKHRKVLAEKTNQYIALIQQTIRANWVDLGNFSEQHSVKVSISLSPSGQVLNVNLLKSSGNSAYDRQALLAVEKSSPLPMPKEDELAEQFREIILTLGGNN